MAYIHDLIYLIFGEIKYYFFQHYLEIYVLEWFCYLLEFVLIIVNYYYGCVLIHCINLDDIVFYFIFLQMFFKKSILDIFCVFPFTLLIIIMIFNHFEFRFLSY